jgi:hypothetical protein
MDGVVKGLEILEAKTKEIEKPKQLYKDEIVTDGIVDRSHMAQKVKK